MPVANLMANVGSVIPPERIRVNYFTQKSFILDVWPGSECNSGIILIFGRIYYT